jgi:hypothetical protein
MISVRHKFFTQEVMPPLLKCLNNCREFLVINIIFLLFLIQLFTKESNSLSFLTHECFDNYATGITINLEKFVKIQKANTKLLVTSFFNNSNPSLCGNIPFKFPFLHTSNQKHTNSAEFSYQLLMKTSQHEKTSYIKCTLRNMTLYYFFHLFMIYLQALLRNYKPKIN